jgi:signal recognition particle subunit SRP9
MAQRCAEVDEFVERVKELYELDPARVRFVLKYRHSDGSLALRATNDELWLLYRTTQASDMRRLEALQLWLMSAMAGSTVENLTREAAEAESAAPERRKGKGRRSGQKR